MKKVLLALLTMGAAFPQDTPITQRIFDVKYGNVRKITEIMRVFPVRGILYDESLRTISVSASADIMKAIEETIKRYDVPSASPNLEFTIYLLNASTDAAKKDDFPAALEPAVAQLRANFNYKSFQTIETMILRCRDGQGAEASSASGTGMDGQPVIYQAKMQSAQLLPEKLVRINGLRVGARIPYRSAGGDKIAYQYAETGVNTDIDVKLGQKVVVGKSSGPNIPAMLIVLTARQVE